MPTSKSILADAVGAPERTDLAAHAEAIRTLRDKNWSWREIAEFLRERGLETDHTKLIRFMAKHEERFDVPDSGRYHDALRSLIEKGQISKARWAMLRHLYDAHNRTATYSELALAAARAGVEVSKEQPHKYANLEFGKLGKLLGQTLGMEFLPSGKRDGSFYSSSIGADSSIRRPSAEYELVMHHELAKALDRLLRDGSTEGINNLERGE